MGSAARRFGWVCALLLLLACPAGAQVSAVVTNLADLAAIVASAWSNTFLARIVPPGPNPWRNDLGLVGFSDSFATDGLVGLSQSGATLWPLDVIETTNDEPRVRTYFNATGGVFATSLAPAGYAQPWTTNAYGSPGAWLSGTNLETWYIEREPARQHVALTLTRLPQLEAVFDYFRASVCGFAGVFGCGRAEVACSGDLPSSAQMPRCSILSACF